MADKTFDTQFLAAQRKMANPVKSHTANTGTFSYTYAALDDTIAAAKAALNEFDLYVTQPFSCEDGWVYVGTMVTHAGTGEARDFGRLGAVVPSDMQKLGGAVTYLRRYALGSLGLVAEDDTDAQGIDTSYMAEPKYAGKPHATAPDDLEGAKEYALPFGKMKGMTLREIAKTDAGYLHWLAEKCEKEDVARAARLVEAAWVAAHSDEPPVDENLDEPQPWPEA